MNLREKIKRILREEISTKLKRRLPDEDLEQGFIESFNIAYRITKNRLISTLPEDENK